MDTSINQYIYIYHVYIYNIIIYLYLSIYLSTFSSLPFPANVAKFIDPPSYKLHSK